jgi:hypothetical protein
VTKKIDEIRARVKDIKRHLGIGKASPPEYDRRREVQLNYPRSPAGRAALAEARGALLRPLRASL